MNIGKTSLSDSKKYPPGSLMGRLKERKIIATLAAFVGSGVVIIEVAHHILVNHYHLPHQIVDICIVTLTGALIGILIWRWFRGVEKRPGNVKVEVLVVPLIILLTFVIDLKFIFAMTGVSINMLLIGIVALCLGIAWVIFKSLQWAASAPEAEKKVEVLKQIEEKPISFPEWKKSIIVLPFENISPEEGQDYFCDGMTEEIITDLSGIHNLRVISRSSAMMLKGSKKTIGDIAKELDVQYVLEGSVRKAGNDIRITAQLIDATTDAHLWADKYNGKLDDVFDLQENVSRSIVDTLKLKLSPEENKRIIEQPIVNIQAYECHLRARREMLRLTEDGLERALRDLHSALKIVGENALLYMDMGMVYFWYLETGFKSNKNNLQKAEEFANKVIKLKPDSSYSHYLLGMIERFRGSALHALKHFRKALIIDPNYPDALSFLGGGYALQAGKASAAMPLVKRLLGIDPLTPINYLFTAFAYWMDGQIDHAISLTEKMIELEPEISHPHMWRLYLLAWKKEYDKVFKLIDQIVRENPSNVREKVINEWCLFFKYALKGEKKKALDLVSEYVKNFIWNDPELPWIWACHYALIDEKDEALKWLVRAINRGWINYPLFAERDPFLENIRGEERFKKLMERVKHEWENFEV